MLIFFDEDRRSNSPFIERVWRSHSERPGSFISIAESRWEMVVTRHQGAVTMTVRGPETRATRMYCPADSEWLGIRFKPGTFLPGLPASTLVDGSITLPEATRTSFCLDGSAWQFPDFENAETFIDRLVRAGLLVREPVTSAALQGQRTDFSLRSVQRRFLQAAGITQSTARQIERARYATVLLRAGVSVLDAVHQAGYVDQPHMIRSLKHFIGQTPTQIMHAGERSEHTQLSFLYNTTPFPSPTIANEEQREQDYSFINKGYGSNARRSFKGDPSQAYDAIQ